MLMDFWIADVIIFSSGQVDFLKRCRY
jgi:hypothetical protein